MERLHRVSRPIFCQIQSLNGFVLNEKRFYGPRLPSIPRKLALGSWRRDQAVRKETACQSSSASSFPVDPNSGQKREIPNSEILDDGDPIQEEARLSTYHYVAFLVIMSGGILFVALLLYFTGDIAFQRAFFKAVKRLLKTVALRQLVTILSAISFVKYGLEPAIKGVRRVTKAQGPWEKSPEYYILKEVYKPLEFLFLVAAVTTLAENMLPQVINIPKSIVQTLVRSTNCLTFVGAAARVVFNIKGRIVRESAWQLELKGDLTRQRRLEAIDKLMSLGTLVVASFFGVRALGMDVNSVLAIGGVGGVAVGLAGREILENLFTGLIILSSNPFEVGDEVLFKPTSGQVVEGIVLDVGWYRTTIRSFEREIFTIPNSVFTRNVVLNITRKNREWRFYEFLYLRLEDLPRVSDIVSDARKILRQDSRIIQKLHRRVFLHNVTREHCCIYISFYVEAANRDAFMAVKQDLLLAFIDCVQRNGAQLAKNRIQLEMLASMPAPTGMPIVDIPELPQAVDVTPSTPGGPSPPSDPPPASPKPGNDAENITVASVQNRGNGDNTSSQSSSKTSGISNNISSGGSPSVTASSKGQGPSSSSSGSTNNQVQQKPTASIPPSAIATSLSNSESARKTIISTISPDAIVGGTQDGATVMGSYDEDCL